MVEIDGKLIDKDVGFAEDAFECLKQACGIETHCLGNYQTTQSEEGLNQMNEARKNRTRLMQVVIKTLNVELVNQQWCEIKHTCNTAMHVQELLARASNVGANDLAVELAEIHQDLYLQFLKILGFTEENINSITSA